MTQMATVDDEVLMTKALRRAVLGRSASPNPMVGCVIVAPGGRVAGVGFHPEPGAPHAETYALREAGNLARGATAYVTLEPCSHYGRTPPCADALIAAGVARVVVAMPDPDTRVRGRGIAMLQASGIDVTVGTCRQQAERLNAAYIKHRTTGLPYVTVKVATTLDGKIATESGDSKWITSALTRAWVHRQLRSRVDAIMVGVGTVIADDPRLTTRLVRADRRNALRIVVDSHLHTPPRARVIWPSDHDGKTLIACVKGAPLERRAALEAAGAGVLECASDDTGRVDLKDLMALLGKRGDIVHVLIEGGGRLIGGALTARIVDRYIATIAPKLIGGGSAPGPVGGTALAQTMAGAISPVRWIMRRSGSDIVIEAFLNHD